MNRGRPRDVPQDEPLNVHYSVKYRMEKLGYKPRLQFKKPPKWVR